MSHANFCRACSTDFASLTAFDKHRVGVYAYAWSPDREDGRRCLIGDELIEAGMELNSKGRWRMALTDAERDRLERLGAKGSAQDATASTSPSQSSDEHMTRSWSEPSVSSFVEDTTPTGER